jgi:predicted TIM-barrel enzyme
MIHVDPLPATPNYVNGSFENVIEKAKHEAHIFKNSGIDSVLIENMHDIPYVKSDKLGPEITSSMARVACEVKNILGKRFPTGIQVFSKIIL